MSRRLVARFITRETLGVAMVAGLLVGVGGDVGWRAAWSVVALTAAWSAATAVVILRAHPDLLAERMAPRRGSVTRDVFVVALYGVAQLVLLLVAGLDHRTGWTSALPAVAVGLALATAACGHGLVVWSTAANAWFSQVVRIQRERGHEVVRTGPYRFVRHPGYAGSVLVSLAVPVVLGSWAALGAGIVAATLMVVRTHLEDRTLAAELEGYKAYSEQVRTRLIPGIW